MIKLDIVLQGLCSDFTETLIREYSKLNFVNDIVLSSYKDSLSFSLPSNVNFIDNDMVPAGIGNRNLQINSSRNGLAAINNKYVIKMRTDQLIREASMYKIYEYWLKNDDPENRVAVPNMPMGRIYTLGMYKKFPYHPRDHVFWGFTSDVKNIFDIPFDDGTKTIQNYVNYVRTEAYIGQYYYARYYPEIQEHIDNPLIFLTDEATRRNEALSKDFAVRDNLFLPFPRISMQWPKYNLNEYHYHIGEQYSEYWAD